MNDCHSAEVAQYFVCNINMALIICCTEEVTVLTMLEVPFKENKEKNVL